MDMNEQHFNEENSKAATSPPSNPLKDAALKNKLTNLINKIDNFSNTEISHSVNKKLLYQQEFVYDVENFYRTLLVNKRGEVKLKSPRALKKAEFSTILKFVCRVKEDESIANPYCSQMISEMQNLITKKEQIMNSPKPVIICSIVNSIFIAFNIFLLVGLALAYNPGGFTLADFYLKDEFALKFALGFNVATYIINIIPTFISSKYRSKANIILNSLLLIELIIFSFYVHTSSNLSILRIIAIFFALAELGYIVFESIISGNKLLLVIMGIIFIGCVSAFSFSLIKESFSDKYDEDNYYKILTKQDLIDYATNAKNYKKTKARLYSNIDLEGMEWTPIGTEKTPYSTIFDGNGFVISNFTITNLELKYVGFFGYVAEGTIQNLGVANYDIYSTSGFVGGLVGCVSYKSNFAFFESDTIKGSTVSNCFASGTLYVGLSGYTSVGGLIGCENYSNKTISQNGEISNNHSMGNIYIASQSETSSYKISIGGLIGQIDKTAVADCYSDVTIEVIANATDTIYAGGFIGNCSVNQNVSNCVALGSINISGGNSNSFVSGFICFPDIASQPNQLTGIVDCFISDSQVITKGNAVLLELDICQVATLNDIKEVVSEKWNNQIWDVYNKSGYPVLNETYPAGYPVLKVFIKDILI